MQQRPADLVSTAALLHVVLHGNMTAFELHAPSTQTTQPTPPTQLLPHPAAASAGLLPEVKAPAAWHVEAQAYLVSRLIQRTCVYARVGPRDGGPAPHSEAGGQLANEWTSPARCMRPRTAMQKLRIVRLGFGTS